jgi:serine/threonine-protein kinase
VYAALQSGTGATLGHALRFVLPNPRIRSGYYVRPASHLGGPTGPAGAIPYGARLRLKDSFDTSGYNPAARVVLDTLKHYGMFLADGGNVPLMADDGLFTVHQWSDPDIDLDSHALFGVRLSDFDVMPIGIPIAIDDCVRNGFGDDVIFADGVDW